MQVYNFGEEELGSGEIQSLIPKGVNFRWIAYEYEYADYNGSGFAYGLDEFGFLWSTNLGHCSCYGPCDDKLTKDGSASEWQEKYASKERTAFDDELDGKVNDLILDSL